MKKFLPVAVLLVLCALFYRGAHAQSIVPGNPTALAQSTTVESSHVFKSTGPSYLYSLGVTTSAAGWAMVFDAVAAPSNGTVAPTACYAIGANSTLFLPYSAPMPFTTGITAVFSTTGCFTQTLGNAFFSAQVR